jgi:hypothetical protein
LISINAFSMEFPLLRDHDPTLVQADEALPTRDGAHRPVVILIHGILSNALWRPEIEATLRSEGIVAHLTDYGYVDLFRFLAPVGPFRRRAVEKVKAQLLEIVRESANPVSVIAHSFGAYVFAHVLRECPELTFDRIIFCGSVTPSNFRWEDHRTRFNGPLINDIGARDIWPALAEAATFGYGAAGTHGFKKAWVRDRRHDGLSHCDFLNAEICRKYWLPWLRAGVYVEGLPQPARARRWLDLFSIVNIRTVLLALALWLVAPHARAYWAF